MVLEMNKYHKINSIFKRDATKKGHPLIVGDWSIPEFEYLAYNLWTFTEKVDGTNIRVMWDGSNVKFGGRTDNANIPAKLLNSLNGMFNVDVLRSLNSTDVCLYGEGYGAGIQKGGGNYTQDNSFVLFDVKIGDWWLKRKDVEEIAEDLNIGVVPIIGAGTLLEGIELVKKGFRSRWGNFFAEGIVAKPSIDLFDRSGSRIVTKIKHKDFYGIKNE